MINSNPGTGTDYRYDASDSKDLAEISTQPAFLWGTNLIFRVHEVVCGLIPFLIVSQVRFLIGDWLIFRFHISFAHNIMIQTA
jgi:hypothetical protein